MYVSKCGKCGSSEFEVGKYQPKDFPTRFSFVVCVKCGEGMGMVDFFSVTDSFRRHDEAGRKAARMLLERQEVE